MTKGEYTKFLIVYCEKMTEFNENLFEQMLDDYLPEEKKNGDVIEGVIIRKEMDYAYLDLNTKKRRKNYS